MWNRNYDRIRAELTKPETDETTHNYGAYFEAPLRDSGDFCGLAPRRDGAQSSIGFQSVADW